MELPNNGKLTNTKPYNSVKIYLLEVGLGVNF